MTTLLYGRGKSTRKRERRLQAQQVAHTEDLLGESPVWCPKRQLLFWTDILGNSINRFDPATNETAKVATGDYHVGCLALVEQQQYLLAVGTQEGVGFFDLDKAMFTRIHDPEPQKPSNRFNDGKVDPAGRFILGTMYTQKPKKTGSANVYKWRCAKDRQVEVAKEYGNVTTSNGLGWNKTGDRMYYVDSPTMKVMEYKYDVETGVASEGRVAVTIPPEAGGAPDGLAVDEEGNIWVCLFRGGKVCCYNPATGALLAVVDLPCPHVTSCCFGGRYLEKLYITTARGSSAEEIKGNTNRAAGALFVCEPGVRGLPMTEFRWQVAAAARGRGKL